jgi:CO/xanthine dehydrogenase FAD-binding subunit
VRRANPLVAEVMQHVAHVPIRNRGTVIGSLCHADPSAELPLLFVLSDGALVARGPRWHAAHCGRTILPVISHHDAPAG